MYGLLPQEYVKKRFIWVWSMLAFQAGFINSIGFILCARFVSHVTGFGTQVGLNVSTANYLLAFELLSAPAAFIAGAFVNGCLTSVRKARGKLPLYEVVSLMIPVILLILMLGGQRGVFGAFGAPLPIARDLIFLCTLSFVCGLQNACFSTLTSGQIRTTHLTGLTTDFGTDLALTLGGQLEKEKRVHLIKKNVMRAATFVSFSMGAIISAAIDSKLQFLSLLIPFMTSLFVGGMFVLAKYENTWARKVRLVRELRS